MIIGYTVLEIWRDGCNYFSFWAIFCLFTLLTARKMKIFFKMKKTPGDIIILHKCTRNHDHMLHCSWDMACDECNCYFLFWTIFLPFYSPTSLKNENFIKMKPKPRDIIILHNCTKNHDHMLYCSWDMAHDGCNCYFSFWAIFCLLSPNSPKNQNFKKTKKHQEIPSFYTCVPKIIIRWRTVPKVWWVADGWTDRGRQTDGQTEGWMEKVTCKVGCPVYKW